MKQEAIKIQKIQLKANKIHNRFTSIKGTLFNLIEPYIDNDIGLEEESLCVDYLAGDGFTFMLDDGGVSVDKVIGRISELEQGEKIKLSDLTLYL